MPYPEHRDPRVLHQLAADQLHEQLSAIEGTDGKIAVLLSLASGLLGIAAATFALHTSATVGNHAETVWSVPGSAPGCLVGFCCDLVV